MSTLNVELVLVNGSVDVEASEEAFQTAMSNYIAQHEVETAAIADAVNAVFDEHLGKSINMPTLSALTTVRLNAQPSNFSALSELVLGYVRANSQGDDSLFVIRKGKNGGCGRRADQPIAAPASK